MRRPSTARRYLFAVLTAALGVLASATIHAIGGDGATQIMPFFPVIVAVTLYAGVGPAVGCWLLALLAAIVASGGLDLHSVLRRTDLWDLGGLAISTALSIAVCARAQRVAFEDKAALLVLERRAQEDAARAATLSDEALAKLSHELRTPLSAIMGWTQVLLAQTPPAHIVRGLEVIERNARAQTRIIEALVDANRPGGGAANQPGDDSPRPDAPAVGSEGSESAS